MSLIAVVYNEVRAMAGTIAAAIASINANTNNKTETERANINANTSTAVNAARDTVSATVNAARDNVNATTNAARDNINAHINGAIRRPTVQSGVLVIIGTAPTASVNIAAVTPENCLVLISPVHITTSGTVSRVLSGYTLTSTRLDITAPGSGYSPFSWQIVQF